MKRAALVLLSVCLGVAICDLAARPLLPWLFGARPTELFLRRWPPLPELMRYTPNADFDGITYGELAVSAGHRDWREPRHVRFVTDSFGFRNETQTTATGGPLDLIVLGDSFGAVSGTTQAEMLASLFARDHGLNVYNLSVGGRGPQQEYVTLLLENARLKTNERTRVVWLLFEGNDLDDPYYPQLETAPPHWATWLERLSWSFSDFRARSPVGRLWSRHDAAMWVIQRSLPDGRPLLFFKPYADLRTRTRDEVQRHPNSANLKTTFGAMKRLADEKRLTIVVALIPTKEQVYSWLLDNGTPWSSSADPSGFSIVLRELCTAQDFRFLDLEPTFVEESRKVYEQSGELLWWRDDTHWNFVGQRIAAGIIYDRLLRDVSQSGAAANKGDARR